MLSMKPRICFMLKVLTKLVGTVFFPTVLSLAPAVGLGWVDMSWRNMYSACNNQSRRSGFSMILPNPGILRTVGVLVGLHYEAAAKTMSIATFMCFLPADNWWLPSCALLEAHPALISCLFNLWSAQKKHQSSVGTVLSCILVWDLVRLGVWQVPTNCLGVGADKNDRTCGNWFEQSKVAKWVWWPEITIMDTIAVTSRMCAIMRYDANYDFQHIRV